MLASELLDTTVVDERGGRLGRVRDVRVVRDRDGFRAVSLLVADGGPLTTIAHTWGYTEGRASGPWLLRRLLEPAARDTLVVAVEDVEHWGAERITLRAGATATHLREVQE